MYALTGGGAARRESVTGRDGVVSRGVGAHAAGSTSLYPAPRTVTMRDGPSLLRR